MYNRGDIEGCAQLYQNAAEAALSRATGVDRQRLAEGLSVSMIAKQTPRLLLQGPSTLDDWHLRAGCT